MVGGFHLLGADREWIDTTARALLELNPAIVRPGHYTGQRAICQLQ